MDFETKSLAGHCFDPPLNKWAAVPGAAGGRKGLQIVGAAAYAEHPSTDILTLSYKLPVFNRPKRWRPGQPLPLDLFEYLAAGGIVESHNAMFERLIWENVAVRKYGFPRLDPRLQSCSMATARVRSYPGGLGDLGKVLRLDLQKDAEGKRLLNRYSVPRNPTKKDPRLWIDRDDPGEEADAEKLDGYCDTDVLAEEGASDAMPPMSPEEREFWLIDQEINHRGLGVDRAAVRDCIAVLEQALVRYGDEFRRITGGLNPTQTQAIRGWLAAKSVYTDSLDEEHVTGLLERKDLSGDVRRVLEIKALIGSASVKKLYAMDNMASADDRLRNLIVHHGARTGRPTGEGAQPLNMPRSGSKLATCGGCGQPFGSHNDACPWCAEPVTGPPKLKWKPDMIDAVLSVMKYRNLDLVEFYFGDAVPLIIGCLRGLFVAGPGNVFIASDYTAIEAVVIAMLAGEQWRIDAFRARKDIYLVSAAKITGRTELDYELYKIQYGEDHPDRQKIGKVAELALGFGGWINAWRQFDKTDNFSDEEVKNNILSWRDASPNIKELWGGQWRGSKWSGHAERYGVEGAAVNAVQYPGTAFFAAGVRFQVERLPSGPALILTLPSGRPLTYHEPRLDPSTREFDSPGTLSLTYMTWNSNPKYGPLGWVRMSTFGGRLTENIVQAIAHDLLRFAIVNLRAAGFHTVLHVYDEIVVEVPEDTPDWALAEVERMMSLVPAWAAGWPVAAKGGWRGRRFRKG